MQIFCVRKFPREGTRRSNSWLWQAHVGPRKTVNRSNRLRLIANGLHQGLNTKNRVLRDVYVFRIEIRFDGIKIPMFIFFTSSWIKEVFGWTWPFNFKMFPRIFHHQTELKIETGNLWKVMKVIRMTIRIPKNRKHKVYSQVVIRR